MGKSWTCPRVVGVTKPNAWQMAACPNGIPPIPCWLAHNAIFDDASQGTAESLLVNTLYNAPEHFVLGPADMPELVKKAEQLLQTAHLVRVSGTPAAHGDARPDNIMVLIEAGRVKQVKLIDMDWAGTVGSTLYPTLLNTRSIVWPDGVGPGQALQQKHDLQLLQLQVNSTTRAAANDWRAMFPHSMQVSDMDVDF